LLGLEQMETDPRFSALSKIVNDERAAPVASLGEPYRRIPTADAPDLR
jgi:hypothetical protein